MPVENVCCGCGHVHVLPDRTFDPETGTTACPKCGEREFAVRIDGIKWHPG